MKIVIRLNAEADGKLVFNYRLIEKTDAQGFPLEGVRLSSLCRELLAKLTAGAGDRVRTDAQMPNCPFKITIIVRKYSGKRVFADMTYQTNANCTSSMLAAGLQVVKQLGEFFDSPL